MQRGTGVDARGGSQRGGRGGNGGRAGAQQHGGGRGAGVKGGRGGGGGKELAKTKRQIEEEQQLLAKKQVREKREEQLRVEHEKKLKELGIESSHSLIPNSLGELEQVPDLSPRWIEIEKQKDPSSALVWFPFLPQDILDPSSSSSEQDPQTTELVLRSLNSSLSKLLKMPFKIFWSHVLFDESFKRFLDSFLRYYPRFYDSLIHDSEDGGSSTKTGGGLIAEGNYRLVFERVFRVLYRLGTNKESTTDFIEKQYYASLVYDKQLYNFPKFLDICVLYGRSNRTLVQKMINFLFQIQPHYEKDGASAIELLLRVLETTASQLLVLYRKSSPSTSSVSSSSSLAQLDLVEQGKQVGDIKSYIVDIFISLDSFLDIFPLGSSCFCPTTFSSTQAFFSSVTLWYEVHLELLWQTYQSIFSSSSSSSSSSKASKTSLRRISEIINIVKIHILNMVSILLSSHFLEFCLNSRNSATERGRRGNELLDCLQLLFEESARFRETNKLPGTKSEKTTPHLLRDLLVSSPSPVSSSSSSFSLMSSLDKLVRSSNTELEPRRLSTVFSALGKFVDTTALVRIIGSSTTSPSSSTPSVDIALIKAVKDVFPDYGEGYIVACLQQYNNNPEQVINNIFEGSLADHLRKMNTKTPLSSPSSSSSSAPKFTTPAIAPSVSPAVYESSEILRLPLHQRRGPTASALMNDKSDLKAFKDRIMMEYEYEDEYDDSHDEFVRYGVPEGGADSGSEDEDEEEEEGEGEKEGEPSSSSSSTSFRPFAAPPPGFGSAPRGGRGRGGEGNRGRGGGRGGGTRGGTPGAPGATKTQKSKKQNQHRRRDAALKKRGGFHQGP